MPNDIKTFNHVHFCYGADSLENWNPIVLQENEPIIAKDSNKTYLILGNGVDNVETLFANKDRVYLSYKAILEDLGVFEFKGIVDSLENLGWAPNKGDVVLLKQTSITDVDSDPEYYMYLYGEENNKEKRGCLLW